MYTNALENGLLLMLSMYLFSPKGFYHSYYLGTQRGMLAMFWVVVARVG